MAPRVCIRVWVSLRRDDYQNGYSRDQRRRSDGPYQTGDEIVQLAHEIHQCGTGVDLLSGRAAGDDGELERGRRVE
jgi:hypothetical protein